MFVREGLDFFRVVFRALGGLLRALLDRGLDQSHHASGDRRKQGNAGSGGFFAGFLVLLRWSVGTSDLGPYVLQNTGTHDSRNERKDGREILFKAFTGSTLQRLFERVGKNPM